MSKLNLNALVKLIEEVMEGTPEPLHEAAERNAIPYPTLRLRPGWGESGSEDRLVVDRLMRSLPPARGLGGIKARIQGIETILKECKRQCQVGTDVQEALGHILILEAISSLVHTMRSSPSGRGEVFESFLAAIIGVQQVGHEASTTKTLADIEGGISAKYFGGKSARPVKGALSLLPEAGEIDYVIALSAAESGIIEFYHLVVTEDFVKTGATQQGGVLKGPHIATGKPSEFSISPKVWHVDDKRFARLDLGSPKEIRAVALEYLKGADAKLVTIYDNLNLLTNQLDKYFIDGEKKAATDAEGTLGVLQQNVTVLT